MSGKEHVNMLLFNKWDTSKVEVSDLGLQKVISLKPSVVIPITFGRHEHHRFKKAEVNITERLANDMQLCGVIGSFLGVQPGLRPRSFAA